MSAFVDADPANKAQVETLIHEVAIPKFMNFVMHFGNVTNGWSSTAQYPNFGADYWFRATANFGGIWWNSSKEAVYFMLHTDGKGQPPTGDESYKVRFAPDAGPGTVADGLWSLTLYGKPDYMLVPNDAGRYTLGYESPLALDADGGTTIYLAAALPDGVPESNWLPIPQGKLFTADLRVYLPKAAVLSGTWAPPALETL